MSAPSPRTAAGFILFRWHDGEPEFLLLRNARHHTWGFAKGHCEPGEGDLEAARREVREETGLEQLAPVDGFREVIRYTVAAGDQVTWEKSVTFFLAEVGEGEIRRSQEHDRAIWTTRQKVRSLIAYDNLRVVFDRAIEAVEIRHRCREGNTR